MLYEALPFIASPERAEIISGLLRETAKTPTLFSGEACEEGCLETRNLPEMCEGCLERVRVVSEVLGRRDTHAWEIWREDTLAGVVFFTSVTEIDGVGHYAFFDHRLHDKTEVIQEVISEMFARGRARLTVEIPQSHVALIRHATSKLGFGGDFPYTLRGGHHIKVEGVRKRGGLRDGKVEDLVVLGLLRS